MAARLPPFGFGRKAYGKTPLHAEAAYAALVTGTKVGSPGRHCHSTLSLTVIDCHSLGIGALILLSSLPFSATMRVSPRVTCGAPR